MLDYVILFMESEYTAWVLARFALTLLATLMVSRFISLLWRIFEKNTIHQKFIKNVLKITVWFTGIILAFSWFPQFTMAAGTLLAGSGIAALMIGFAAQESLGNAFNGMFISMFKPFEVGDRVHFVNAGITGFIEDITIRHTVIRTFTNSRLIVPNSTVNKEIIENSHYHNPQASSFIDVTVTYDSDVDAAREIMARVLGEHPEFTDTRTAEQQANPKVPVFVRSLGIYGVELRASMWTSTVTVNFSASSDVRLRLLREFRAAGVKLASTKFIDPLLRP
jgi:small-conductance mechanosensitive channel